MNVTRNAVVPYKMPLNVVLPGYLVAVLILRNAIINAHQATLSVESSCKLSQNFAVAEDDFRQRKTAAGLTAGERFSALCE